MRSQELLHDFVIFCCEHPELRFWQALAAFSKWNYVLLSQIPPHAIKDDPDKVSTDVLDTFHCEGIPELPEQQDYFA